MPLKSERVTFPGSLGVDLAARLDLPHGKPRAYALFAHCFSCSKDVFAAARISQQLAADGIAVLRFDFTGLGHSDGDFSNTTFSSNVGDLLAAVDYLRKAHKAPTILIGHSLGGAAVIMAAGEVPECKAVVTLGAPADTAHTAKTFFAHLDEIEQTGKADVQLGGRPFTIRKEFVDDLKAHKVTDAAANLKRALLVMHAPLDAQVGIENASAIFAAAKHPKSFISLDDADHLITRKDDAIYAANVLCAWVERFLDPAVPKPTLPNAEKHTVVVTETGNGFWESFANAGGHELWGDQPPPAGGNHGPAPYEYVAMGLALCTNQTLRMYARQKRVDPGLITTTVRFEKVHLEDAENWAHDKEGKVLTFSRAIEIPGDLPPEVKARMVEIADLCPVHKALEGRTPIKTELIG